jgi:hypothetical protein
VIDLEHCPNRGGELKIIAAFVLWPVIGRIQSGVGSAPTPVGGPDCSVQWRRALRERNPARRQPR